ncbi:ABC transporter permease [Fibrella sp. HMF5335]|uniref:ABC transporter permease n=1 Tax=Fibrella rubiginis TaxID=2817060 RepID=A0A939K5Q1_9BACT|nr:ABC transporter permease [Fibrella rubiginis]MBO0937481.1 ABC transporter permease [Fibrella rubiginis]
MTPLPKPPRLADRLLEWLVAPHRLEAIQGDLHEEFAYQVGRVGLRRAQWRYWRDLLGFARPWAVKRLPTDYSSPFFLHPDMLSNYLKIAWRNLVRQKLYSLINLCGLALGLAASVLILLWVQNELSFDSYHRKANTTYRVTNTLKVSGEPWIWSSSPLVLGDLAQRQIPDVERITRFKKPWQPINFRVHDDIFSEENSAFIDSTWFACFDYEFLAGSATHALDEPGSVILTENKARTWFGDPQTAVGKTVLMDTTLLTVQAVVRNNRPNSSFRYDVLVPIAASFKSAADRKNDLDWNNFNYQLFLQLKPGTSTAKIGQQLTQFYRAYKKDSTLTASLLPLKFIHFETSFQNDELPKGSRNTVWMLGLVGLVILIIASINYVNLSTALASQRAKEVGVKKIIGAGRGALFGQFLIESTLLTVLALGVALLLIWLSLPLFNDFTENQFSLDLGNGTLWLLLLGSVVATVVLSGVYPAALLSSLLPVKVLKGGNVLSLSNAKFRQGLVVTQFAASIILIISTMIIFQQLRFVQSKDPGYQRDHVFCLQLPFSKMMSGTRAIDVMKRQLRELSGVAAVTSANQPIVNNMSSHSGSLKWAAKPDDFTPAVSQFSVEPEFRSVFDLKLTAGRWFRRDMRLDTANVILNEAAVKSLGLKAPVVGQWFEFQSRRGQIIGVTQDFNFKSLHEKIDPMVLFDAPGWHAYIFTKVNPGATERVLADAERIWKASYPDKPFKYTFLDDSFAQLYKTEQKAGQLFNVFAGIAVLISCLGLFGLATFSAERRHREIGVRKVLGASVQNIVALLSKDFLKLVLVAIVIASPLAWYAMNRWLQTFAYHVAMPWWVFVLAGLLAVVTALLTISFQSIRAALTNPVKSLRSE